MPGPRPAGDGAANIPSPRGSSGLRDGELELLEELVRIPSPSGGEGAAAGWLQQRMLRAGMEAAIDEAGNLVGELAPESSPAAGTVYLLGHIDTVAGFWPPSFDGTRLHGRGASDAKGPLAAFVCAALRARASGALRRPVRIIGAVEEEGSSRGARHLAASLPAPAFLVVGEPSGAGRVVLGYQGSLRCQLEISRQVGHSSRPAPTAAELGVDLWLRVRRMAREWERGAVGFEALTVHLLAVQTGSDGITDTARVTVGFRLPPRVSARELVGELGRLCGDARMEVQSAAECVIAPRTGPLPAAFAAAIRAGGGRPSWQRRLATSDLNVVLPAWQCPAVVYGPGDSSLDHTPEESIAVADYGRAITVLAEVLARL